VIEGEFKVGAPQGSAKAAAATPPPPPPPGDVEARPPPPPDPPPPPPPEGEPLAYADTHRCETTHSYDAFGLIWFRTIYFD
jgi:hypothetical protein